MVLRRTGYRQLIIRAGRIPFYMAKGKGRLFGAHVSISGGIENAPERGKSVGCNAIQVFTKNSNRWQSKPLQAKEIDAYKKNLDSAGIEYVAAHDSYLINLASPDKSARKRSLSAFIDEIERAGLLGIPDLVFHPGSHLGSGDEEGLKAVAECMNHAIEKTGDWEGVTLTVETTAGQGSNLGHRFEHIRYLMDNVENKKRVGVCVDTCHIFTAGYDLRKKPDYEKTFRELGNTIGFDHIRLFHVNDSKKDFASRVDRHEHIGKGYIGLGPFGYLVNDPRFKKIPMILETPKGKDLREDKENLGILRNLIGKA
jgi:deoxyribonuclease-4